MSELISSGRYLKMTPKELAEMSPLEDRDKVIASSIKQYMTMFEKVPTHEQLSEWTLIEVKDIEAAYEKPAFQALSIQLGLPLFSDVDTPNPNKIITMLQLSVADAILNHMDKRTVRQKLNEFGVKPQTYKGWMANNEAFRKYMNKRAGADLANLDWLTNVKLTELVEEGDLNAIRLVQDLNGKLSTKVDVNVNVNLFMAKIIEVITKHVTDPLVLERIADDVDVISHQFGMNALKAAS